MIAAVSGDADRARKKAARARALIGRPALGQMISAQAADLSGDADEARAQYTAMLSDDRTQKFGLRGLATLAHKGGDLNAAIDHAKSAYENNKSAQWAFDILFSAQIQKGDWAEALKTLELAEQRKHIAKDKAARRRAVINTARAQSLEAKGQSAEARELAASVVSVDSGFAPGAALAARLYVKAGEPDRAAKSLERAWKANPHPALALAYADVFGDEPDKKRARRMKSLRKQNSNHRESVLLLVQEGISSGDAQAAWQALSPLLSGVNISGRLCELAAKTEALRGNVDEAALWSARAASAPIEADWSDLDPQGTAFNYNDTDWARMVVSYGDDGALIHPRRERFETARPALGAPVLSEDSEVPQPALEAISEPSLDLEDVKPPNPDF
jgi:HemY protein